MNASNRIDGSRRATRLVPAVVIAAASYFAGTEEARAQTYVPSPEAQFAGITAWFDTQTSTEYVIYVCGDQPEVGDGGGGICVLTCGQGGCWIAPDAGGPVIAPVNGLPGEDAPNVITDTGTETSAEYWANSAPFPNTTQYWGGQLTGFFDGSDGHVYFSGWRIDPTNTSDPFAASRTYPHLFEYSMDGAHRWHTTDLTAATGATTPFATNLTDAAQNGGDASFSSLTSLSVSGFEHVFYLGQSDQAVHDTYYNAGWQDRAVTPRLSNAPLFGAGLTSYYDGSSLHVIASGQEYYASDVCTFFDGSAFSCTYSNAAPWWTGWTGEGLGGFLAGTFAPSTGAWGQNYSYYASVFGETGLGSAQSNILNDSQAGWSGFSLGDSSLPNYNENSPTVQYADATYIRTFYVGGDQHIYDSNGSDLMPQSGAPNAAYSNSASGDDALGPITGFYDGNVDHVFYIAVDSHVHEIWNPTPSAASGGWYSGDLSAIAQATSPSQLPFMP